MMKINLLKPKAVFSYDGRALIRAEYDWLVGLIRDDSPPYGLLKPLEFGKTSKLAKNIVEHILTHMNGNEKFHPILNLGGYEDGINWGEEKKIWEEIIDYEISIKNMARRKRND